MFLFLKVSPDVLLFSNVAWYRLAADPSPASSERLAGSGGCRPRCGDKHRAGRRCPRGCSPAARPAPSLHSIHEAPADDAPRCQSEAESRRQRACTGASGSPGRGRVWLTLARTRASPPGCWAPMGRSRFMATSSPTHCRTTAGSCQLWARTPGGGRRSTWPEGLCWPLLHICCTNCCPSGTQTRQVGPQTEQRCSAEPILCSY